MNEDLDKALMILAAIQREYPAVYRNFELDKVAQHILDSQGPVMLPFIQTMTDEEKARFVETTVHVYGNSTVIVATEKKADEG